MTEQVTGTTYHESPSDGGEVAAGASVTPGMGIEKTGSNPDDDPLLQPVSSIEPADAQTRFAVEQGTPPRGGDGRMIDQASAAGEHVEFRIYRPGDVVENALVASGTDLNDDGGVGGGTTAGSAQANVSDGDSLAFYSDGSLKVAQSGDAAVAVAREDVDNSGAAAGDRARISVEVL